VIYDYYKEIDRFRIVKVFDVQYMPDQVKKIVFDIFCGKSNSIYVDWDVFPIGKFKDEILENADIIYIDRDENNEKYDMYFVRGDDPVSDWLYDHGADQEEVLIKD